MNKNKTSKPTAAQRAAQSRRDKAASRGTMVSATIAPRSYVSSNRRAPSTQSTSNGMIVRHTEVLAEAIQETDDSTYRLSLVPSAFPWLRGVASSYSKYRWKRLRVFYITAVSTTSEGRVAMGYTYDQSDDLTPGMTAIISMNRSTFGPVWSGQGGFDTANPFMSRPETIHSDLDSSKAEKAWYPYISAEKFEPLTPTQKQQYTPAILNYGVDKGTVQKTVGSFYVSYEIELIEPTFSS